MSGRTPSPRDEEPTEEEVCADCLGGLLFSEEECSTCEPRRKLRKANPEIARRVASDEWKSLLEEARKHLGFHGADHLAGYWMALGLVVPIHYLMVII